jgi:glutaredoxin
MPTVELMTRKGCHLCDDVKDTLTRLQAAHPFELVETDVDLDPQNAARYGMEVPVVLLDGHKVAKFRLDEQMLLRRLRGAEVTP